MRIKKSNNQNKTRQKKKENLIYRCLITILVIWLLYYTFIKSHYIGSDYKYVLFGFWTPVLIGVFIIVKFNLLQFDLKEFLIEFKEEKNSALKFLTIPVLILMYFTTSVMIFWTTSDIIWDSLNKIEASKNRIEIIILPVTEFHKIKGKGSHRIYFYHHNELESLPVSYKTIEPYLDKDPSRFRLKLEVRKGIWNYYIVDSYDILE